MARGTIYFITKDKNQAVDFKEENYYDRLDIIHADYVQDEDEDSSKTSLGMFKDTIGKLGAVILPCEDDFNFSFRFNAVSEMQRNHFKPKLETLKEKVKNLNLFDVIQSAPDLNSILNDDYDDVITLGEEAVGSTITVDDFIRRVEPGITYYVYKKTILIH